MSMGGPAGQTPPTGESYVPGRAGKDRGSV
jgi:hypothetical protein